MVKNPKKTAYKDKYGHKMTHDTIRIAPWSRNHKCKHKKLLENKLEKSISKMKNLHYEDLKPQDYLRNLDIKEAKNIFKFRVKMAKFSENYNKKYCKN